MANFINLTPHTINVIKEDGTVLTIPTSGTVARCTQTETVLDIHDGVKISDGVSIETHSHPAFTSTESGISQKEHLEIDDHVNIGTRAIITESCHKIGRYAKIGAGSVVRGNIPPYAIVMGNPAKIIKFIYKPEEMIAFEETRYKEEDQTPLNIYTRNYKNYYLDNLKEITSYIKQKV